MKTADHWTPKGLHLQKVVDKPRDCRYSLNHRMTDRRNEMRSEAYANEMLYETCRMRRYGWHVGRHALQPAKSRKPARRSILARLLGL